MGFVIPMPKFPESVRDIKTFEFPFNQLKLLVPVINELRFPSPKLIKSTESEVL